MDPKPPTETADQRRAERRTGRGTVRVVVDAGDLAGAVRDASGSGVMFTTSDVLAVRIEIEVDGVVETRSGRLSRIQRLNADEIAVAVELDD
jgi:hypothetical protein